MPTKILILALIFNCLVINSQSQKKEFKFGRIDQAELASTRCPIDSTADAYVICDVGNTYFNYDDMKGYFIIVFEKYVRIKILKKPAFDYANMMIPLYKTSLAEEQVDGLRGNTYNLENGKMVISKLEKKATFKEEVNKNWDNLRFTMPNVKEGSVVEYTYKVQSEFSSIESWDFQRTIPVLFTQYTVSIPEYYNYKVFQNGYEAIKTVSETQSGSLTMQWKDRSNARVTSTSFESQTVNYNNNVTTYTGENLKGFRDEPYMKSKKNYISSIEFELESTHYPYSMVKLYSSDWKSITKDLMDDNEFGTVIKQNGAANDIVKKSTFGLTQPLDKAKAIYTSIRDQFKWNGSKRIWASKTIRKTIEDKSGNSADINLLLIAALRNAGIKANPVVLSTRDNGMIITAYPLVRKLNYVIAWVKIDSMKILLDATDKQSPFGFLPQRCLNGQGRILFDELSEDVDLTCNQNYFQNIVGNFVITENGDVNGTWNEIRKGYAAYNFRTDVADAKNKDDFVQSKQKETPGLSIEKYQFDNLDTLNKEINIKYDLSLTGHVESTGDLLMIHPLLSEQLKENLYKTDERKFPVDYSYGYKSNYVAFFEIPQGYQVETLPKPVIMSLPNKDITYTYNIAVNTNKVQVLRKIAINKIMFLPEEYANLKEFYNQMVAKEAEVIVLKKI